MSRASDRRAAGLLSLLLLAACGRAAPPPPPPAAPAVPAAAVRLGIPAEQVPGFSDDDLEFLLHGSMGTEVVPERLLAAFREAYPDLVPPDLAAFGAVPDPGSDLPVGFSRRDVAHLGGLSALGVNCMSCHAAAIDGPDGRRRVVLGAPGRFDVNAYSNAVLGATFRSRDPANLSRVVSAWMGETVAPSAVAAVVRNDPAGASGLAKPSHLHRIDPADLDSDDPATVARALLRLMHNMRAALHVPDAPPRAPPGAAGPGRNDAFGLLALEFFGIRTVPAPAKYGIVWNLEDRRWVHWDGNNDDPHARNLAAALGLGAPIEDTRAILDFSLVDRHTRLSQRIRAPRWPEGWPIDRAAAERGAALYAERCAGCHDVASEDSRLHDPAAIGVDPNRAAQIDTRQSDLYVATLAAVEIPGYVPSGRPPFRITGRYWAPSLAGVWARAPYLHNGSVRTLADLMAPPGERPRTFRTGTTAYDVEAVGYADGGWYVLDTSRPGESNAGHDFAADLPTADRRALLEHLKTL